MSEHNYNSAGSLQSEVIERQTPSQYGSIEKQRLIEGLDKDVELYDYPFFENPNPPMYKKLQDSNIAFMATPEKSSHEGSGQYDSNSSRKLAMIRHPHKSKPPSLRSLDPAQTNSNDKVREPAFYKAVDNSGYDASGIHADSSKMDISTNAHTPYKGHSPFQPGSPRSTKKNVEDPANSDYNQSSFGGYNEKDYQTPYRGTNENTQNPFLSSNYRSEPVHHDRYEIDDPQHNYAKYSSTQPDRVGYQFVKEPADPRLREERIQNGRDRLSNDRNLSPFYDTPQPNFYSAPTDYQGQKYQIQTPPHSDAKSDGYFNTPIYSNQPSSSKGLRDVISPEKDKDGNLKIRQTSPIKKALTYEAAGPKEAFIETCKRYVDLDRQYEEHKEILNKMEGFELRKFFKTFDVNNNKIISTVEFANTMLKYGVDATDEEIYLFMCKHDIDNDGKFRLDDFMDAFLPREVEKPKIDHEKEEEKDKDVDFNDIVTFYENELRVTISAALRNVMGNMSASESLRMKLTKQYKLDTQELFNEIDQNTDGHIDYEELEAYLKKKEAGLSEDDMKLLFARFDQNKQGKINYTEFITELKPRGELPQKEFAE